LDERTWKPSSWVGRLRTARGDVVGIAQRLHLQNEAVRNANGKPPAIPLPQVRQETVKRFGQDIGKAIAAVDQVELEVRAKRASLRPFASLDASSSHARRERLLDAYAKMPKEEQARALKEHAELRYAIASYPPFVSGMLPSDHALLIETQLEHEYGH